MNCIKDGYELKWNSDQQEDEDFWSIYSCYKCESEYEYRQSNGSILEIK